MFSAGYDIGEIPDEEFEERAERLVAHPFTRSDRRAGGVSLPDAGGAAGPYDRRRPRAGAGLRPARGGQAVIKLGMPPAKLGLVYSHTGLRRFIDAIGAARTRELFLLGRYIDATTALSWGLVNRVASAAEELEAPGARHRGELASNAPLRRPATSA
jgi:hypothetical protein